MDTALYIKMLTDKSILNLKKLKYKYPEANMQEFFTLLKSIAFETIPLPILLVTTLYFSCI